MSDNLPLALPHHNLPARDYAQFIGRQRELAEVRRLLHAKARPYLLTVDGIGGIGKSSLALEAAYVYLDPNLPADERYDALVWLSAKRTVLTPERIETRVQQFQVLGDVFNAIAQTLNYPAITQARVEDQRAVVERALGEHRTLLILDNLETINDPELLDFLRDLPAPTKALVTTRHRIDNAYPIALVGMPEADAFALIDQEAERRQLPQLTAVRRALWERTGGVPLAIVWSVGLIAAGEAAEAVIRRLGSGQSDIIEFCFGESMALIRDRDAHTLLLAAALFPDDASGTALGHVAQFHADTFGLERGLDKLVQLSLLAKDHDRYSLLSLTRTLLRGEAQRYPEVVAAMTERWITYYDQFVDQFSGWSPDWRGHDEAERELTNIFAVYHHLVDTLQYHSPDQRELQIAPNSIPQARQLLRIFDKVSRTCRIRGYWGLIETESVSALRISRSLNLDITGWLCYVRARVDYARGDYASARRWAQEMADIANRATPRFMRLRSELMLGLIAIAEDKLDDAAQYLDVAWERAQQFENISGQANILTALAELASRRGNHEQAVSYAQQAVDRATTLDDKPKMSLLRRTLGVMQVAHGDVAGGRANLEKSLAEASESGWLNGISDAAFDLARLYASEGDSVRAIALARRAADGFHRLGIATQHMAVSTLLTQLLPPSPQS